MCPRCHHFTTAPVGQKRRRCSYCGTIINIAKAACALFDTPDEASTAVKIFNASKGGDDFETAVDKSKERIRALVPLKKIKIEDLETTSEGYLRSGKRKQLMHLLEKEAQEKACSLDRIESLCKEYQLEWTWVEQQLTGLSNSGELIFPKPWTVLLVKSTEKKKDPEIPNKDVSKEILIFLRQANVSLHIDKIIEHFSDEGILSKSVESSLERLMRKGEIFEPKPGYLQLI